MYLLQLYYLDVIVNIVNCGETLTYKGCGKATPPRILRICIYIFSIINLLQRTNSDCRLCKEKQQRLTGKIENV